MLTMRLQPVVHILLSLKIDVFDQNQKLHTKIVHSNKIQIQIQIAAFKFANNLSSTVHSKYQMMCRSQYILFIEIELENEQSSHVLW